MKEAFTDKLRLSPGNKIQLDTINGIVDEYREAGYVLTLRQLYYQLVSRGVIANKKEEYAKLSGLLTKGRMAGIVDWAAIEDRGRQPQRRGGWDGVADALESIAAQYRRDRRENQPTYIEVWVEKDALSNIFKRVTVPYGITLMVNKGYSSTSAMKDAADRFKRARKPGLLAYFGDHDASGKDMVRDITDRLATFKVRNLQVINPALTMDQVTEYDPPENFQKQTDPRAQWYINEYGESSWELDALTPQVLTKIINDSITPFIDMDIYIEVRDNEAKQKAILQKYSADYDVSLEDDFDGGYEVDDSDLNFNNDED